MSCGAAYRCICGADRKSKKSATAIRLWHLSGWDIAKRALVGRIAKRRLFISRDFFLQVSIIDDYHDFSTCRLAVASSLNLRFMRSVLRFRQRTSSNQY
jgi:hypothetical protein